MKFSEFKTKCLTELRKRRESDYIFSSLTTDRVDDICAVHWKRLTSCAEEVTTIVENCIQSLDVFVEARLEQIERENDKGWRIVNL